MIRRRRQRVYVRIAIQLRFIELFNKQGCRSEPEDGDPTPKPLFITRRTEKDGESVGRLAKHPKQRQFD